MTDDQLHARLHAAGARWRDANPATATATLDPDPAEFDIAPARPPHRRQRWITAASAAVVAAALAIGVGLFAVHDEGGSGPTGTSDFARITGVDWQLESVHTSRGTAQPVTPITLAFSRDGSMSTSDGCNTVDGTVAARGAQLVITGTGARTQIGCGLMPTPSRAPSAQDVIEGVLDGPVRWSTGGNTLTLTKPGVGTLVYTRGARSGLLGVNWVLTGTETDVTNGNSSSGSGQSAVGSTTLSFDNTGGFFLQRGCTGTSKRGRADVASTTIGLSGIKDSPTAGQRCSISSTNTRAQNRFVDSVLTGKVTWSIEDDSLTISKNGRVLTFQPERYPDTQRTQLVGHTWVLTRAGTKGSTKPAVSTTVVVFDGDQSMRITRCFVSTAYVKLGPGFLAVSKLHVTGALSCPSGPPGARAQNNLIDSVLNGTIDWSIKNGQLTLTKGKTELVFKPR